MFVMMWSGFAALALALLLAAMLVIPAVLVAEYVRGRLAAKRAKRRIMEMRGWQRS